MSGAAEPAAPSFSERLQWTPDGEIRDGEVRYLMLRADALMGMLKALPDDDARGMALAAFAASIVRHGGKSARKYQAMGAADADTLLAVICQTAPQLGWGVWRVARREADRFVVEVRNSPFAAGWRLADGPRVADPATVCGPIVGMLTVVGSMVFAEPVRVVETVCACGGGEICLFEVALATAPAPAPAPG